MMKWWDKHFPKRFGLVIYMKSGNKIFLDNIIEYEIKNDAEQIVSLSLVWHKPKKQQLLVKTIQLNQIEAVTKIP